MKTRYIKLTGDIMSVPADVLDDAMDFTGLSFELHDEYESSITYALHDVKDVYNVLEGVENALAVYMLDLEVELLPLGELP